MEIAHLQPLSLLDYPGKVAAVVWTVGCNLRCPFCYNAELVLPELASTLPRLSEESVISHLRERAGFLDGLVVTGGEPTLHPELPPFLREVKALGLAVKLDTNGTRPDVLGRLLREGLLDYVALDVKAPFARYAEFTGLSRRDPGAVKRPSPLSPGTNGAQSAGFVASELASDVGVDRGPGELGATSHTRGDATDPIVRAVEESIRVVRGAAPHYEFRTTVAPGLARDDLMAIAYELRGSRSYVLQPFFTAHSKRLVDEEYRLRPALPPGELEALAREISPLVPCVVRG